MQGLQCLRRNIWMPCRNGVARRQRGFARWPCGGLLLLGLGAAQAQGPRDAPPVVIQGPRAAAETAESKRRAASDIVDSELASELLQLPDQSVADALQRITGVQITRDRGEASAFAVRGLTQVETTLNGREIFTAGAGRQLDLTDVPAELLAGIDVYKTSAADRLDGGLGGTADLRTLRPLDLPRSATVMTARLVHGHLVARSAGQGSLLLSRRTRLGGPGELAVLAHLAVQDRAFREDQKSTGNPVTRTDLLPGTTLVVPNGSSETASAGTRLRQGLALVAQWRPDAATEWLAEFNHVELRTRQDSHQINVTSGSGFVPGSLRLFEGTNDLRNITWTDAPVSVLSFARDTLDRTHQGALGVRHDLGNWRLSADLSHALGSNRLFFSGPFLAGRVAEFQHDLSGRVPGTRIGGTDLLDPTNLRYTGLAYRVRPFRGELTAAQLEARWQPPQGPLRELSLGLRSAERRAQNAPGLIFGDVALSGPSAAESPDPVEANPFAPTLDGRAPGLDNHLVGGLDSARDAAALRALFGVTAPLPGAGNPLGVWQIRERTDAAYLKLAWGQPARGVDGHAGLRVVRTAERVDGSRAAPSSGGVQDLAVASHYTDWLPSAALRWRTGPAWQWRVAASRTIARPNFDQLSPSLSLVANSINPALNVGGAGNPALRPVRARHLDLALESLGDPAAAWSVTGFRKWVDGFIANASQPETWDGAVYQVSRPYNSDPARVQGLELAGLKFFDQLPGAARGLGLRANYTYVDSATPDRRLGGQAPLQNLSRHTLNVVGLFDQGRLGARLAWNWRSSYLSGVTSVVGLGALPVTTRGAGWWDGAVRWRVDPRLTLSLEASNLTRTLRSAYNGVPTRPQSAWVNDRQLALSLGMVL